MIAAVGVLDDVFDLPAGLKLLGQAVAAMIPVFNGVQVTDFTLPFVGGVDLTHVFFHNVPVLGNVTLAKILTVLGFVAVMNVINFIDGVDGLAAGVCVISAATLSIIALSLDRPGAAVLAALTGGASLGFLRHGFPPASSFMGDTGSNLLGYLLAATAVLGALKTNAVVALFFPLIVLAVPILDTGFVVAKRIKYRRPVYQADRWHFHHRHGEHRVLAAPDAPVPLRVGPRAGGPGAGASLRPLQRQPRPLRPGVDRGHRRVRSWRLLPPASTCSSPSRSSSSGDPGSASWSARAARRRPRAGRRRASPGSSRPEAFPWWTQRPASSRRSNATQGEYEALQSED